MEYKKLNNGILMPMVGFGAFQIPNDICSKTIETAIGCGYRLIDTAQAYHNETEVGEGIIASGIPRSDIFLTTKVWVTEFSYDRCRKSVEESMAKLKTGYLDLVLAHQCLNDYYGAYRALVDLYHEGKIRAIGVSNFSAERLADLCAFSGVKPMVDQVETHPFFQQEFLHGWMDKLGVVHEAWGPLSQHRIGEVINSPVFQAIAASHRKTPAQVALRFQVQRGILVIPKSINPSRMKENIDIFDFLLTEEEMASIRKLDEDRSLWAEYDDPNIVGYAMS